MFNSQDIQGMNFVLFFPGISHQLDVEIDWKLKELRENSSTQPKADLPMEIRVATEYEKKTISEDVTYL